MSSVSSNDSSYVLGYNDDASSNIGLNCSGRGISGIGQQKQQQRRRKSEEFNASVRRPSYRRKTNSEAFMKELTVNKLRFSLLDIYGRQQEEDILHRVITRATSTTTTTSSTSTDDEPPALSQKQHHHHQHPNMNQRELVLIAGESGTGKTALASTVKRRVRHMRGAFVTGKFDAPTMDKHHVPYSAILAACSELCCQLLALKNSMGGTIAHITPRAIGLGNEGDLNELLRIIPDLGVVLGMQSPLLGDDESEQTIRTTDTSEMTATNSNNPAAWQEPSHQPQSATPSSSTNNLCGTFLQESRNRFHYLFRKFFRGVGALLEGPLVLVLDDLQWADFASLDLLEVLLTDNTSTAVVTSAGASVTGDNGSFNFHVSREKSNHHKPNKLVIFGLYR
jgi:predicted ATPase